MAGGARDITIITMTNTTTATTTILHHHITRINTELKEATAIANTKMPSTTTNTVHIQLSMRMEAIGSAMNHTKTMGRGIMEDQATRGMITSKHLQMINIINLVARREDRMCKSISLYP
jgi:hypothetical protein